jgi:small subunit ribosomal protein S15
MSSIESMALRSHSNDLDLDTIKLSKYNENDSVNNNKEDEKSIELSSIPLSLRTANQSELTKHKIGLAIEKFKSHTSDTGSAAVQIAVMTEKIHNLARHYTQHKKDKHSARGFQILIARRKKTMQYLKRYDFEAFKSTIISLGLQKEASHLR